MSVAGEWLPRLLCVFALLALLDAATTREDAFRATDKQTKRFWMTVLGVAALVTALPSLSLLGGGWAALAGILGPLWFMCALASLVATIVYYVDVRATLKQIRGRRTWPRRGPGRGHGPYGPFNGRR
ncbi:DUF2516 family protein [Streptomyces sp. XD-27]|uniref:DUF2516 family protein n=1 Tax=Streptomyces sp. XD-27 TaxID=3062779 RepID=UPI0026F43108|nr:DUF2516 family protein [Streptomyces sp. XD-27]WKX71166.1 DUF2516 family protein [Streptomyces sp. XD-27]